MCDEQNCKVNVNDIFEGLCRTLSKNHEVDTTSEKFAALSTNAQRVLFVNNLLRKYSLFPKLVQHTKDDELSTKYRQDGNDAFKKKNDFAAWSLYTKSIAYANSTGECLALAYANRSAVLYQRKLYKQCLEDITSAFKNNYPKHLYEKLIQREEKARELLSTQDNIKYYEKPCTFKEINKKIQCANASVEIRNSKSLGRHVVAVKKIKLGEVIAVEKPFAQVLLKDHLQDHCYFCFELCYNLMPCDNCIYAMYCSAKCKLSAWNQYHRYECPILATLYNLDASKLTLMALRVTIMAREAYGEIEDYRLENAIYKSQCYEEIHFLESNTRLRTTSNLFSKATTAAILRNIIRQGTSFHHEFENPERDENIFNELIMRHLQTGPTNFHEISEITQNNEGFVLTEEIGAGAYAFLSLLNHSCTPNVVRHCHGTEIVLRAIKPIPEGTELLDNYGYHYAVMRKADRQRELQRQYFFNCVCEACENNWPLYNNLPKRGGLYDIPKFESLTRGDREEALTVLMFLINSYEKVIEKLCCPNKFVADLQETIKQCYALLGNRKPQF